MITKQHPIIFNTPRRLIEGSSWITHVPFAFFLISILKPKVMVELGVFSGQSYCAFCQAVKTLKLDTRCYGIDTWKGDTQLGAYGEEVFEELKNYNQREYADFSRLFRMTFDDARSHFEDGSIDLLHIDGFHTYKEVKNDFEHWLPKMSPRGVVLFHDTFIKDLDFGVWKLWEEVSAKYPGFEFVHGGGLGVVAVGREVNEDFIGFLNEAQSDKLTSKLFYSLGELAFSELRINKLTNEYNKLQDDYTDYKEMISNSSAFKVGLLFGKFFNYIAPPHTVRRNVFKRYFHIGIMGLKKLSRFLKRNEITDDSVSETKQKNFTKNDAIPEDKTGHYIDTIKLINTMPLPPSENGNKKKCAIFVMVKNESVFLPIWLKYYSRYIDGRDIYVFDHRSVDGSIEKCMKDYTFNVIKLNYPFSFDHVWFRFVAQSVQKKLFDRYEYAIFTDVDEIIMPDIKKYSGLDDYIQKLDKNYVRCIGYELIHLSEKEKPYDPSDSVLSQRRFWYYTYWYNKTLISNKPTNWGMGFHNVHNLELNFDNDLMLIHLHKLDFDHCWRNSFERARLYWSQEDMIKNWGWQNRFTDIDKFKDYYYGFPEGFKVEEIPEELRKSNLF